MDRQQRRTRGRSTEGRRRTSLLVVIAATIAVVVVSAVALALWAWVIKSEEGGEADIVWRFSTEGPGPAQVGAMGGGMLYVGGGDDNPSLGFGNVFALDATTGEEVWRFSSVGAGPARVGGIANGMVYVASGAGDAYALDAATGQERWRFLSADLLPMNVGAVGDQVVYVGSHDHIIALEAITGQERWRFRVDASSAPLASVVAGAVANGVVYCWLDDPFRDGIIYALDEATGTERWRFTSHGFSSVKVGAVANGAVYAWPAREEGDVRVIDAATGVERLGLVSRSPGRVGAVGGELVYAGTSDGAVFAYELSTGHEAWRVRSSSGRQITIGAVADSVVYAETDLFSAADSVAARSQSLSVDYGALYALNALTGEEYWSFHPEGGALVQIGVVLGGLVYASSGPAVYAISGDS